MQSPKELNLQALHNSTVAAMKERFGIKGEKEHKSPCVAAVLPAESLHCAPSSNKEKVAAATAVSADSSNLATAPKKLDSPTQPPAAVVCSPSPKQQEEIERLKSELAFIQKELHTTQAALTNCQKSEQSRLYRLTESELPLKPSRLGDTAPLLAECRRANVVQRYGALFSNARCCAREALDSLGELGDLEDLKDKLLFSIIVLAHRSCQAKLQQTREKVSSVLQTTKKGKSSGVSVPTAAAMKELDVAVCNYLRKSADWFDLDPVVEEVRSQIRATLYDYPCLETCAELRAYVEESAQVAWRLCVLNRSPLSCPQLDCSGREFSTSRHTRSVDSTSESTVITGYLWPCLIDGESGMCLYKGVVVTQ